MSGKPDPGSLEFEKVSFTDARKALEETGPAAYAAPKKSENWEEKRSPTVSEPLSDAAAAWIAELPESVRPRQLALRCAGPGTGIPNQLRRVETTLRLPKEHSQDTLLRLRKQRICEALSTRPT